MQALKDLNQKYTGNYLEKCLIIFDLTIKDLNVRPTKKAALAAIKNRPEAVKNDFSDYSSNSKGSCPPKARENLRSYSSTD